MSSICPLLRKDRGLLVSLSSCTLKNSLSLHHYDKIVPLGSTAWSSSPHKQDQKSNLHRVICNESADSVVQRGCRLWSVRACVEPPHTKIHWGAGKMCSQLQTRSRQGLIT